MKDINQLDLFSGIGGFHLGFERAGYKVNSYFSEVDKHAVAVYKHQFKDSTYVGSVTDVRGADLPRIDLITFGSPCQDFSLAGKRKGMGGERSSLILQAIRLIHECRPRVFIWENVKGTFSSNDGADFWAIIQAFANIGGYRLEWQLLNTSWFLPQNRERIYLVGYLAEAKGDWEGVFPIGGSDGEDNVKRIKVVGDRGTGGQQGLIYGDDGIAPCLNAHTFADPMKIKENLTIGDYRSDEGWRPRKDGNCPTLAARAREDGSGQPLLQIKNATQQGYEEATIGDSINYSNPNSKTRNGRVGKGRANTLDTACSQAVVEAKIIGYTRDAKGKVTDRHLKDTAGTIHSSSGSGVNTDQFVQDYRIRRLTPIECERLQGFPDNHTSKGIYDGEVKEMSNTQRYKQCGNAVTVDVVQAIANKLHPLFEE
jgi:DNA (cytosine-5)-methyltransferase 1